MTYLIDTNVLVYALDARQAGRQQRARAWLTYLLDNDAGALSTQALTELANVCLHRLEPRWSPARAAAHIHALSRGFDLLPVTSGVVQEALRGVQDHHLSFFDAQMWAVARLNELPCLLTQDMATGSTVGGVLILDPFETPVPGSTPGQDEDTARSRR